jgi:outer membrane immunogenic protein
MKYLLAGIVALSAFASVNAARAADMPVKAPSASSLPPATYNWSGFYAGFNAGYGWGAHDVDFTPANAGGLFFFTNGLDPGSISAKAAGGLVGGQIGYNWQWNRDWVAGLEADIDWAAINGHGSAGLPAIFGIGGGIINTAEQRLTSIGTVRGRLGYAVDNTLLFYATGGFAYGKTTLNTSAVGITVAGTSPCGPVGLCSAASSTQWAVGWTAGAGVEWALTSAWSLKGEYLYYDLGSRSQTLFDPADAPPPPTFNSAAAFRGNIVRVGLNYHFH